MPGRAVLEFRLFEDDKALELSKVSQDSGDGARHGLPRSYQNKQSSRKC